MLSYEGSWLIHTNGTCGIICVQTLYFHFFFLHSLALWPQDILGHEQWWTLQYYGGRWRVTMVTMLYRNIGLNLHLVSWNLKKNLILIQSRTQIWNETTRFKFKRRQCEYKNTSWILIVVCRRTHFFCHNAKAQRTLRSRWKWNVKEDADVEETVKKFHFCQKNRNKCCLIHCCMNTLLGFEPFPISLLSQYFYP